MWAWPGRINGQSIFSKIINHLTMKTMKHLFLLVFIASLFTSCASIKVSCDYDKSANFAAYKTYQFTQEVASLPIGDLNRARLTAAIESELAAKGFTKSDKPDVMIDVQVRAKEMQTATANTSGGYGGYGRYRWGGGFTTTTINYDSYTEGTFFVNMIDASNNQLVWQGRAVGTLDPDASADKRESNIKNGTKQVFTQYPPKKK
jgi:hypothetical protein